MDDRPAWGHSRAQPVIPAPPPRPFRGSAPPDGLPCPSLASSGSPRSFLGGGCATSCASGASPRSQKRRSERPAWGGRSPPVLRLPNAAASGRCGNGSPRTKSMVPWDVAVVRRLIGGSSAEETDDLEATCEDGGDESQATASATHTEKPKRKGPRARSSPPAWGFRSTTMLPAIRGGAAKTFWYPETPRKLAAVFTGAELRHMPCVRRDVAWPPGLTLRDTHESQHITQ
eukprot:TRINITY_DN34211_c0_g1_i1.p1 TRINITY_DN34211_c0_g1~~TRINITY_DN34211_c0_g1_i1.p1  ORF type:complete len:230 (-),score=20.45 TRINITY_DN34211_c0_g1_i1:43-732(-)